jgi:hypothetical protein
MMTNEDEPAYILAARSAITHRENSSHAIVRELVARIDRDAATLEAARKRLALIENQANAAEMLCRINGADLALAVVPAGAIRQALTEES